MTNVMRFFLAMAIFLAASRASEAQETLRAGDVVVVPIHGEISAPTFLFLRRAVKAAEAGGAVAIVIEMDTYGGELEAAEKMSAVLNRATLPTYTFVNVNAGSAGALIALATKHIYMAPVSAIGAAAPVLASGGELAATEREKTLSYWSALLRASSSRNGHNPDLGEAFMSKEKEVRIGERVVHARGTLLTLNAQEASERINGAPLLADGIAESVPDLAQKAGLKGRVFVFASSGFERLALWITTLAPLLLLGGIVFAYLEFKIPGASLPGFLSAACFAFFFFGHYLAGLAGWEVGALFVVGLVFLLVEVLIFAHSTIFFGVLGVFLILASLLWAMIDRYPGETFLPSGRMLAVPVLNLLGAMIASVLAISLLARFLPRTNLYRRFVLSTSNPSGPSFAVDAASDSAFPLIPAVGARGTSLTILRPSGKASFDNEVFDVVTQGDFIGSDIEISVVGRDGLRVVVKAL